ncbi:hypothetical protein LX73_0186 [Fodinibius salinus]|uniref:CAAX prenyl protease 2/Lysostaphin resistance protein A-like domain-containing protein n=1 Tax=Fodinibius salinus TaxID=860790 RepID=A0A5D3YPD1_9BACT|nr:CPBP family intramembrane glutamic endopeptidase [Fodinibius salinus]TYP94893.1 hypothetical protein LX73_0186 [Fodinibius salinus]
MEILNTIISLSGLIALLSILYLRYQNKIKLGFSFDKWAPGELILGISIAFVSVTLAFLALKIGGFIEIKSIALDTPKFFKGLGTYAIGAAAEEIIFRVGLLLLLIYLLKNIWVAILLQIILFGVLHITNPSATLLTAFSNAIGGLMYSIALIYTGRIWMPFSLHVFWNFAQSFWGFNVSGLTWYSDIFVHLNPVGTKYLSGGEYGLEGSIIGIIARLLVLVLIVVTSKLIQNYYPQIIKNQYSILPQSLRPT